MGDPIDVEAEAWRPFRGQGWRLGGDSPTSVLLPPATPPAAQPSPVMSLTQAGSSSDAYAIEPVEDTRAKMKTMEISVASWLLLASAWQADESLQLPPQIASRIDEFLVQGTMQLTLLETSHGGAEGTEERCAYLLGEAQELQGVLNRVYQFGFDQTKQEKPKKQDDDDVSGSSCNTEDMKSHEQWMQEQGLRMQDDSEAGQTTKRTLADVAEPEDAMETGDDGDDGDSLDEDTLFTPTKKKRRRLRGKQELRTGQRFVE